MKSANMIKGLAAALIAAVSFTSNAIDNKGITHRTLDPDRFTLLNDSRPVTLFVDPADDSAVGIAAGNLAADFARVSGNKAQIISTPKGETVIIGTIGTPVIDNIIKKGIINREDLAGKNEKYIMTVADNPLPGVDRALIIAGSDRRGTVYGVYELSEQIGVSPWYDWADVPVSPATELSIERGTYTAGEPAVKYRGIFLNDEAPCLTNWVKNTYGTDYGDHRFYERVNELILRLRGNFLWPAMWSWSFYGDDPENSRTADRMGVIMGTSHHEPMARNHREYVRKRADYGPWNYAVNKDGLNRFFSEGIRRMKDTEDVVTIGMRGDGDEAMSADADVKLLEEIISNQRKIIKKETGRNPKETPQVWALYKEVLDYYDAGLRVPDDVTMLLCDDNWGNVRRLPNAAERKHPGGWGMYYHVDYVGAPRNSKLLNCTPIQNMIDQLSATYDHGVDRLWILNVGDLKPMEYPITLFLDMAWNPGNFDHSDLTSHSLGFCTQIFGEKQGKEAARILNLLCKYNGRVTPEMLNADTYSLHDGEFRKVVDEYAKLEAEALRQYITLPSEYQDAYRELILFPVQLMGNLYEMYYAQAMNRKLYAEGDICANEWADRVESCFKRDAELMEEYNKSIAAGKWNGMMTQKHIGYIIWDDTFPADTMPEIKRLDPNTPVNFTFEEDPHGGYIVMEAPHYAEAQNAESGAKWTFVPDMGRTLGAMALLPYSKDVKGAKLSYSVSLPEKTDSVEAIIVLRSNLAFSDPAGHCLTIGFGDETPVTVNTNGNLNEHPDNIYSIFYPTVARRVIEKKVKLPVPAHSKNDPLSLNITPLHPGITLEKIVLDFGGYAPSYLYGEESPKHQIK